jgi:hypothetical protein
VVLRHRQNSYILLRRVLALRKIVIITVDIFKLITHRRHSCACEHDSGFVHVLCHSFLETVLRKDTISMTMKLVILFPFRLFSVKFTNMYIIRNLVRNYMGK